MNSYRLQFCTQFARSLGAGTGWLLVLWVGAYLFPGTVRPLLDLVVALAAALTHYAQS